MSDKSDKIELPYTYIGDEQVDLRYFPKVGDKLKVGLPGGISALTWAKDNNELLVVTELNSARYGEGPWVDAGFVSCDFVSEKGRSKYPDFKTGGGCYISRFILVEQAKTDEEALAELDNLIVVEQEDERKQ